jgi:hypothetical protein
VIEFLGAVANYGSRTGSAVGENISYALSECHLLKEIVEPLPQVGGHPRKVFFRENPGIQELEGKGDNLRR